MNREQKVKFVKEFQEDLESSKIAIVTHYHGLKVQDITKLRKKLKDGDVSFKVVKNRLAKIAIKDTGFSDLDPILTGPTALVLSNNPVTAAKILVEFANDNENLKIVGGVFDKRSIDQNQIVALSKLPSLEELRATLVGMLVQPSTKIAQLLQAPGAQIARVISSYVEKNK
jgi:large subunit ribosomal protein L10